MVKHPVTATLSSRLIKIIEDRAIRYFGGNRSVAIEYYLTKGLESEQKLPDISIEPLEKLKRVRSR